MRVGRWVQGYLLHHPPHTHFLHHPHTPSPLRSDCAWGQDELLPLSCRGGHWLNLSLTMVDGLSTLSLLGLTREFDQAVE